jgi:hypothetical protein
MPLTLQCPNPVCRKSYDISEHHRGGPARCGHCGTSFAITPPEGLSAPIAQSPLVIDTCLP